MELTRLTAREMAALLRRKEVSARELAEAHLERIAEVNAQWNAVVTVTAQAALERASALDEAAARGEWAGPLHGIPLVHKDLLETRGVRTTYGSPLFADHVPDFDCAMVARAREAGAVCLGKSNTPEFGAGSQTFNPVFGATRNPFDASKTCGGSSGGAAVTLATGMAALADGTDTGGSLRNPAAFCGVVGLRTTPGLVPLTPNRCPESVLSVGGPMARNAADAALYLQALRGQFAEQDLGRDFRGVRVGFCAQPAGMTVEQRVVECVERARGVLESMGCEVVDLSPDFTGADAIFRSLRAWEFWRNWGHLLPEGREKIKATVLEELDRGAGMARADFDRAMGERTAWIAGMERQLAGFEFVVLPVTQVAPFSIDMPYVSEIEGVKMESYIDWMRSCYFVSLLGWPAASTPCGFTVERLPVGVQLVGRTGRDWEVLQIAHAYGQASGIC